MPSTSHSCKHFAAPQQIQDKRAVCRRPCRRAFDRKLLVVCPACSCSGSPTLQPDEVCGGVRWRHTHGRSIFLAMCHELHHSARHNVGREGEGVGLTTRAGPWPWMRVLVTAGNPSGPGSFWGGGERAHRRAVDEAFWRSSRTGLCCRAGHAVGEHTARPSLAACLPSSRGRCTPTPSP